MTEWHGSAVGTSSVSARTKAGVGFVWNHVTQLLYKAFRCIVPAAKMELKFESLF